MSGSGLTILFAQVGLGFDLSRLVQPFLIFMISSICLILSLFALVSTQWKQPNIRFALMTGSFCSATGLVCLIWGWRIVKGTDILLLFPAFAIGFGALTFAAGIYMHRRVESERREEREE